MKNNKKYKTIIIILIIVAAIGLITAGMYCFKYLYRRKNLLNTETGIPYQEEIKYNMDMIRLTSDEDKYAYYTKEELIELIKQFDERNKTIDKEYFYIVNFQYEGIEYPAFKDKSHKKIDWEKTEERFHQLTQSLEDNCTYRLETDCTNEKWIVINLFHIIKEEKPTETEEEEDFISPNKIYSNFLWME